MQYAQLSVSKTFFIGGMDTSTYAPTKFSTYQTFQGCLRISELDSRDPVAYFLVRHPRVEVIPNGPMLTDCNQPEPIAIEFTKPSSTMIYRAVPETGVQSILQISISIRTFHLDGLVISSGKRKCSLMLGMLKGRVFLQINNGETGTNLAKIESKQFIANGAWHKISIAITHTDMFLMVDSGSRLSAGLPKAEDIESCSSPKELYFGGSIAFKREGFVGCLNDIKVNGNHFNESKESKAVSFRNGVRIGCGLQDKCFPNPCRNGGKCGQTWKEYTCDCSGTTFYGSDCEISIYKQSCAAYQTIGLNEESYCLVDTDGPGDLPPFTTKCKFDDNKLAFTTVHHNKEVEFDATAGDEKVYNYIFHKVKYEMPMSQIESLIQKSKFCRQFVKFKCYNAMLLNAPSGPPNVLWRARTGEARSHWGGVTEDGEGCACGVNDTCVRKDILCNCDFRNNKWMEDSGYLMDKKYLPLTRLDVTAINDGYAYFDVGKYFHLRCLYVGFWKYD